MEKSKSLTIEELVNHVTKENDYDASSIMVGVEQVAQSQYPTITQGNPIMDKKRSA